jgi:hypothetical protein
VKEHYGGAGALVVDGEFEAVTVHPPHDGAAYGVWTLINTLAIETKRPRRFKQQCEAI